jgi:hypothetical protein
MSYALANTDWKRVSATVVALGLALLCSWGCAEKEASEPIAFCHRHSLDPEHAATVETVCFATSDSCAESTRQWAKAYISQPCEPQSGSIWCFHDDLTGAREVASCTISQDDCEGSRSFLVKFYAMGFDGDEKPLNQRVGACQKMNSFPAPKL